MVDNEEAAANRSSLGYSRGHWDHGDLVMDSAPLADHRSTYSNGEPPGAHKHIIECYSPALAGYGPLLIVDHPELVEE